MTTHLIPAKDLLNLVKSLAAHAADGSMGSVISNICVEAHDDGITFTATDGYRLFRTLAPTRAGNYPNVRQVLDAHAWGADVTVPHAALVQALKAMKTTGDHRIRLTSVGGVLWIATDDDLKQDSDPTAPVGTPVRTVTETGEFVPMRLNRKYLLDAVTAVGPDKTVAGCVRLVQTETCDTPLHVTGGLHSTTTIIMPVRY